MTTMEIALLIVGVIIFVISFLMPDIPTKKSEKELAAEKDQVKRLVEQEVDSMKLRVNEATNDSVEYAVDKAERSLERVSNEKIMAVNEYAGTILEEINKNHQEVMFLYDMLRDKQEDLTNTVRKADIAAKEIEVKSINAQKSVFDRVSVPETPQALFSGGDNNLQSEKKYEPVLEKKFEPLVEKKAEPAVEKKAEPEKSKATQDKPAKSGEQTKSLLQTKNLMQSKIEADLLGGARKDNSLNAEADIEDNPGKTSKEKVVYDILSGGAYREGNIVNVDSPANGKLTAADYQALSEAGSNSNDKILALAKQGYDTVSIAKSLGLGVGEVKLVIDLYQ